MAQSRVEAHWYMKLLEDLQKDTKDGEIWCVGG
jgi:hypothetical protein